MHYELTPETHKLIVRLVRNGNYLDVAAAAAGVPEKVAKNWLERGRVDLEEPYLSFWRDVIKAEATKEDELLGRVEQAGRIPEFWQASAWLLARRFPKRWQEKVQIELANELERILTLLEQRLDRETYDRVLEVLSDTTPTRTIRRPIEPQDSGARALPPRSSSAD